MLACDVMKTKILCPLNVWNKKRWDTEKKMAPKKKSYKDAGVKILKQFLLKQSAADNIIKSEIWLTMIYWK